MKQKQQYWNTNEKYFPIMVTQSRTIFENAREVPLDNRNSGSIEILEYFY